MLKSKRELKKQRSQRKSLSNKINIKGVKAMKTIQNIVVQGISGKPIMVKDNDGVDKNGSVADMIKLLILNLRTETMAEVISANRVWKVVDTCEEVIGFEDADYDWLAKAIKNSAPKVFGVNAIIFEDAMKPVKEVSKVDD